MRHAARSLVFVPILVVACGSSQSPPPEAPAAASAPEAPPAVAATPVSGPAPAPATKSEAAPAPPAGAVPALRYATALATPESVLYDEVSDRYLVSNINGNPCEADGNGYILALSPESDGEGAKWIEGGVNKAKLNAPKGLAISKGVLYVADIDVVRTFDAKTGTPKADIPVPGATFLNDVAAAKDGKLYVSDSGLKAGANGMEPTGTDAFYVIENGKAKPVVKSKELAGPNGLLVTDTGVIVSSFGSNELYRIDKSGKRADITPLPEGGLDGIVAVGDSLLVASWKASAVYKGKLGGTFVVAIANLKAPADIGYDKKRNRLLVPRFMENTVEAYTLD